MCDIGSTLNTSRTHPIHTHTHTNWHLLMRDCKCHGTGAQMGEDPEERHWESDKARGLWRWYIRVVSMLTVQMTSSAMWEWDHFLRAASLKGHGSGLWSVLSFLMIIRNNYYYGWLFASRHGYAMLQTVSTVGVAWTLVFDKTDAETSLRTKQMCRGTRTTGNHMFAYTNTQLPNTQLTHTTPIHTTYTHTHTTQTHNCCKTWTHKS